MENKYLEVELISLAAAFVWFYPDMENMNTVH